MRQTRTVVPPARRQTGYLHLVKGVLDVGREHRDGIDGKHKRCDPSEPRREQSDSAHQLTHTRDQYDLTGPGHPVRRNRQERIRRSEMHHPGKAVEQCKRPTHNPTGSLESHKVPPIPRVCPIHESETKRQLEPMPTCPRKKPEDAAAKARGQTAAPEPQPVPTCRARQAETIPARSATSGRRKRFQGLWYGATSGSSRDPLGSPCVSDSAGRSNRTPSHKTGCRVLHHARADRADEQPADGFGTRTRHDRLPGRS